MKCYFFNILFGCCIFIIISCTHSTEPELNSDAPTIILENHSSDKTHADLTIINGTNKVFTYLGYAQEYPIYGVETKLDADWVNCEPGWYGTGLLEQTLNPITINSQLMSISEIKWKITSGVLLLTSDI